MTKAKEVLTDVQIRAWIKSAQGDSLYDGGGLYLRRRGSRAYWAYRQYDKVSQSRSWVSLLPDLPYPEASLKMARQEASRARHLTSQGETLSATRRAESERRRAATKAAELADARRITIRQLFVRWKEVELQPQLGADGKRVGRKDGGAYTEAQFERHVFPSIGDMDAPKVGLSDLQKILDAKRAAGKLRTAAVLYSDLKQMFKFALGRDIVTRNPLDILTKKSVSGSARHRERTLSDAELKLLVESLPAAQLTEKAKAAVWVILATGCRVAELMGAVPAHMKRRRLELSPMAEAADVHLGFVDLDAATWHLPTTKNGRDHTIHLSRFAIAQFLILFKQREGDAAASSVPWLFPARLTKEQIRDGWSADERIPGNKKSLTKQLADRQLAPNAKRLEGRSKAAAALRMPDGKWTPHDLRRTAATIMTRLGFSGDVVDEALNHTIESRVRRTYIRDRREAEQRRAFDALGAHLEKLTAERDPIEHTWPTAVQATTKAVA